MDSELTVASDDDSDGGHGAGTGARASSGHSQDSTDTATGDGLAQVQRKFNNPLLDVGVQKIMTLDTEITPGGWKRPKRCLTTGDAMLTMPANVTQLQQFVREEVAVLGECPTNLHQATEYYCLSEEASLGTKLKFLFSSYTLLVVQLAVAVAVRAGVDVSSCSKNAHCDEGQYCDALAESTVLGAVIRSHNRGNCNFCGNFQLDALQASTYNDTLRYCSQLASEKLSSQTKGPCSACYDSNSHTFDDNTIILTIHENLLAMRLGDWITVCLASFIVSLAIASELRDIKLCQMSKASHDLKKSSVWKYALGGIDILRQYAFLPALTTIVPALVLLKGGDALNICFNTVAILFLLECDNQLYDHGLSERTRAHVEEFGRAELDDDTAGLLALIKTVHIVLVSLTIPLVLVIYTVQGSGTRLMLFAWIFPVFLLGGLIEPLSTASHHGDSAGEVVLGMLSVVGRWLIGLCVFSLVHMVYVRDSPVTYYFLYALGE